MGVGVVSAAKRLPSRKAWALLSQPPWQHSPAVSRSRATWTCLCWSGVPASVPLSPARETPLCLLWVSWYCRASLADTVKRWVMKSSHPTALQRWSLLGSSALRKPLKEGEQRKYCQDLCRVFPLSPLITHTKCPLSV